MADITLNYQCKFRFEFFYNQVCMYILDSLIAYGKSEYHKYSAEDMQHSLSEKIFGNCILEWFPSLFYTMATTIVTLS